MIEGLEKYQATLTETLQKIAENIGNPEIVD